MPEYELTKFREKWRSIVPSIYVFSSRDISTAPFMPKYVLLKLPAARECTPKDIILSGVSFALSGSRASVQSAIIIKAIAEIFLFCSMVSPPIFIYLWRPDLLKIKFWFSSLEDVAFPQRGYCEYFRRVMLSLWLPRCGRNPRNGILLKTKSR